MATGPRFASGGTLPQAEFIPLGHLPGHDDTVPYDISADGSVVVGESQLSAGGSRFAFVWRDGQVAPLTFVLPQPQMATGVSGDGLVIVGKFWHPSGEAEGFRWQAGTTMPVGFQDANALSHDGNIVVGADTNPTPNWMAVKWSAGSLSFLGDAPGCGDMSIAYAVTPDGSTAVGLCTPGPEGSCGSGRACVWSPQGITPLADLPGGSWSTAYAVSADATVVVGSALSPAGHHAVVWRAGHLSILPDVPRQPSGLYDSDAKDVSGDGRVIVGFRSALGADKAVVWYENTGQLEIRDLLIALGLDMAGWQLERAHAVSADGTAIVGYGVNPQGKREAWLAILPNPPAIPATSAIGLISLAAGILGFSAYRLCSRRPTA